MCKHVRCRLYNDESRIWNMDITNVKRILHDRLSQTRIARSSDAKHKRSA